MSGSFGGAIGNYPSVVRDDDEIPPLLFAFNSGAIIVNKNGVRFANEAQSYKVPAWLLTAVNLLCEIFARMCEYSADAHSSVRGCECRARDGRRLTSHALKRGEQK